MIIAGVVFNNAAQRGPPGYTAGARFIKSKDTQNDVIELRSKKLMSGDYKLKKQKGANNEI
jgi:hypothetical protein